MKKAFNLRKALVLVLVLVMCISAFVACDNTNDQADLSGLNAAKDTLKATYRDQSSSLSSDYEMTPNVLDATGKSYTVTWTVNVTEGGDANSVTAVAPTENNSNWVIKIVQSKEAEIKYTLTATISDGTNSVTHVYQRTVPKWRELTWAEYNDAETGDPVVVKGYVVGIIAKSKGNTLNGLYIQDEVGGYYIYNLEKDPAADLNIKEGMLVRANGTKDVYSGTLEVKDAAIEILDQTITAQTPVDYTEIYTKAETLKDAALASKQGLLVTVKGVTLTSQETSNGYYKFTLGGKESYIRISSSVCPLTKDEQTTMAANHKQGYIADVTGVICVYNSAFYLTPVDANAISNLKLPELSGADAVAAEKGLLSIATSYDKETVVSLPAQGTNYSKVAISWAFKDGTAPKNATIDAENGKLTIVPSEEAETFTIVATLTEGEASDTVEFIITIDALTTQEYLPVAIESPVAGKAYKLVMEHEGLDKTLYATGEMSGYYYATTEKYDKAKDIYVAEVKDGETLKGYQLYYLDGENKVYLEIVASGTYINVKYQETATENLLWSWNSTLKTFTITVNDTEYFLGTQSAKTYSTFSACKVSAADSSFIAHLCTLVEADYKPVAIESPVAGKAYKLVMEHEGLDKTLYATGEMSGYYYATTEKYDKAKDIYVAEVKDGETLKGYQLYYLDGENKVYLEIVASGTYINVKYQETATENLLWSWNSTLKTFTITVNDTEYFLGTQSAKTYSTFSACKVSAANSSFIAHLCTLELTELENAVVTEFKANTAYKLVMEHEGLDKTLYATGEMSGYYYATTEKYDKAKDIYVAEVKDGETLKGYQLYYLDGENKVYLEIVASGTYINVKYQETATENLLWSWNSTLKTFTITVNDTEYFLGTQSAKTYSTFSACKVSAADSSFIAHLVVRQFKEGSVEETDADKIAKIEVPSYVSENFKLDESATWTVKSGTGIALDGVNATVTRGAEDQTVVLTATIGEETKDFTVRVLQNGKVVLSIADYAKANSWVDAKISASAETDYFTATASCTNPSSYGQNTGKYYTSDNSWRIYQNETPSLTIAAKTGYSIVSVKVTYTLDKTGIMTQGDTQIASDTVVNVNAESVTFSVGNTGTATNGQIRVAAIEVVYAVAE